MSELIKDVLEAFKQNKSFKTKSKYSHNIHSKNVFYRIRIVQNEHILQFHKQHLYTKYLVSQKVWHSHRDIL